MTTYRLINNSFDYSEAYVDFRAMRRNYDKLTVQFSTLNDSLKVNLTSGWKPVNVKFECDSPGKKLAVPDLSVWNLSCLVLSQKAYDLLSELLLPFGEIFPLNNNYYLFNCLESIDSSKSMGSEYLIWLNVKSVLILS